MKVERVVVVTGGRSHYPTCRELEAVAVLLAEHGVTTLRHGDSKGVDRLVAGYVSARGLAVVEKWPADWDAHGNAAGPRRNRIMLAGGPTDLFGNRPKPQADLVIALEGGSGTADCKTVANAQRVRVVEVAPVREPRVWNRHHGEPPGPSVYVGRGTPLGNPEPATHAGDVSGNLDRYRRWLWDRVRPGSPNRDPEAVAMLERLTADHFVVCSCWPAQCHGEYVVAAWRFLQLVAAG